MQLEEKKSYKAKLKSYELRMSKEGEPYVYAEFNVVVDEESATNQLLSWVGSLKAGPAREITLRALLDLGLSGPNMLMHVADGPAGGALDLNKEVSIVPVKSIWKDRVDWKVNFINPTDGSRFKKLVTMQEFQAYAATSGLQGDCLAMMQKDGDQIKETKYVAAVPAAKAKPTPDMSDIPF